MVTRVFRYGIPGFLALVAALAAGGFWLLWTTAGAQWMLGAVSQWTPVNISANRVVGAVANDLRLDGVKAEWPEGGAAAERLHLQWRLLSLFGGHLEVQELTASGIEVRLPPGKEKPQEPVSEEPFHFSWPKPSGLPLHLQADIRRFEVTDLTLRPADSAPVVIERFAAGLAWRDGILSVSGLEVATDFASGRADLRAGFVEPFLELSADANLTGSVAGLDRFVLNADLGSGDSSGEFAGALALKALSGDQKRYGLDADLTVKENRLHVGSLALTRPGSSGRIDLQGELTLAADPDVNLEATIADLDLQQETGVSTLLSGYLRVTGRPGAYQGVFSLANRLSGWQEAELGSRFSGDLQGVVLNDLQGRWLKGDVNGDVRLEWERGFRAEGQLAGRRLDPSVFSADFPGRINLDLDAGMHIPEEGPLAASVQARLLDSRLRRKALTGLLDAELQGDQLAIGALELHGDGFDLAASGTLQERLAVEVDIRRLGGLIPETKGQARAEGWLRWQDKYLSGELDGLVRNLVAHGMQVEALDLELGHRRQDEPIRISARGRSVVFQNYRVDDLELEVGGSLASHQGHVQVRWPEGSARGEFDGGYREGSWNGTLTQAGGEDRRFGRWGLEKPARLAFATEQLLVEGLALASRRGERVEAQAELSLNPLRGNIRASADKFDLARANHWLADMDLQGAASGDAEVLWRESGGVDLAGELEMSATLQRGGRRMDISLARAEIDWGAEGLMAGLRIECPRGDRFTADISSAQPARLGLPEQAEFALDWESLALNAMNPWLPSEVELSGNSAGDIQGEWKVSGELALKGMLELDARIVRDDMTMGVSSARTEFSWDRSGLLADLNVELEDGGWLSANLDSPEPGWMKVPERGSYRMSWEALDLAWLQPFFPPELTFEGMLAGTAQGRWLPDLTLEMTGRSGISDGRLGWQEYDDGEIVAHLRQAEFAWAWKGQSLKAEVVLELPDYGRLEGECQLPLEARLPAVIDPQGELRARLAGEMHEKGLLGALLPGVVQETRGELEAALSLAGTWQDPQFSGGLKLARAGAYLPAAGIQLEGVSLQAEFSDDQLQIESFQVRSGPGQLTGEAEIQFRDWQLAGYRGDIRGERFELINLPELQVQINPDLQLEGDLERLKVRGEVKLPKALVTGKQDRSPVERSQDVVFVHKEEPAEQPVPLELDIRTRVELGDRVLVKLAGIDARLDGALDLMATGPNSVTAQGEINVVKGAYSAYGVKLNVSRGKILFAGGPIDRPTLDVLALRTVGEVKAGVRVSGTPRDPVVKLYSEPGMPDTDILGYIVLGHPPGSGSGQTSMLMVAAGALLSKGESAVLQDRLQRRLGLDVIDIRAGNGDVESSMITLGKYLSPELYISVGQGLMNNASEFRMRYSITEHWEVESNFGIESGSDLFYKIEFH
ncbi:MAG: translocation/assembly module TamB domain-containing protein [Desulfuromonadales bacterium]